MKKGNYVPRLKQLYETKIKSELAKEMNYLNVMQVPKLEKIVVNMGLGSDASDSNALNRATKELASITGRKPVVTRARKSIAGFKVRKGVSMGLKVTLRSAVMFDFLDRLINIALPRVRDFRGLSQRSFDKCGNFAFGIPEQVVFYEVDYDKVDASRGMDVIICTSAKADEDALALLKSFGLPFMGG